MHRASDPSFPQPRTAMPSRPLSPAAREKVIAALDAGSMIEAVRLYRLETLSNLSDAKAAVEAMQASNASPPHVVIPSGDDPMLMAIYAGRKIEAIKQYRLANRVDLRTAKLAVEAIEANLRVKTPERFAAPSPSGSKGCLGWIIFFLLAVLLVAYINRHALHH